MMEITPQQAKAILTGYREHPAKYIRTVYGSDLWKTQAEIVDAVFKHRNVAVKSCNAIGKSYIAARVAHAFLDLHPNSIVVTTAPTWRQVSDIFWREFGNAHNSSRFPLGGRLSKTSFEIAKNWYAVGLSTTQPEKFFGYHADYILVVVDEASGIDEPIFDGVRAITPNQNAHTLFIGNPTNADGTFGKAFKRPDVKQFTVSAFDTPNFKAAGIENLDDLIRIVAPPDGIDPLDHKPFEHLEFPYPALIGPQAVYERYLEWGTESPLWSALIMGEFPSQADNNLIPLHLIQGSMDPDYRRDHNWKLDEGDDEYGLDVARFGSDRTVLCHRHGDYVEDLIGWAKLDTVETSQRVIQLTNPLEYWSIKVDDTGVGGGVTDNLVHMANKQPLYHYRTVPVNFGQATTDPIKFFNFRTEMFWTLAERFKKHKIALPNDPELAAELASIRFHLTPKKQIRIEDKDEIKKRVGKSPDKADALALAFAKSGYAKYQQSTEEAQKYEPNKGIVPLTAGLGKW